jgi:hypothetical protein
LAEYRVYIVGSDGHFQKSVPLDCVDDDAAMEQAKKLAESHAVELWPARPKEALDHKPKI